MCVPASKKQKNGWGCACQLQTTPMEYHLQFEHLNYLPKSRGISHFTHKHSFILITFQTCDLAFLYFWTLYFRHDQFRVSFFLWLIEQSEWKIDLQWLIFMQWIQNFWASTLKYGVGSQRVRKQSCWLGTPLLTPSIHIWKPGVMQGAGAISSGIDGVSYYRCYIIIFP